MRLFVTVMNKEHEIIVPRGTQAVDVSNYVKGYYSSNVLCASIRTKTGQILIMSGDIIKQCLWRIDTDEINVLKQSARVSQATKHFEVVSSKKLPAGAVSLPVHVEEEDIEKKINRIAFESGFVLASLDAVYKMYIFQDKLATQVVRISYHDVVKFRENSDEQTTNIWLEDKFQRE